MIMPMVKRTSLNLQTDLVAEARAVLGTRTTTDTVHRALAEVVRRRKLEELADWDFDHLEEEWLERLRRPRTDSGGDAEPV
jgi:Arc/MetJ family transcription regulator